MKKFISFSGGVESSTMCLLYGNKADAIFSDTGFEHQQIYNRIDLVEAYVKQNIRKDFKVHKITNGSLIEYIKESKFYPSFKARFCTRMFKIEPIDKFLDEFKEVELMIGLNYEEADKRTGNHGNKKNVTYSYPLVASKISREGCKIILKAANLMPNFPVYMSRGGCIGCYFKSKKEYKAMAMLNPKEFSIVEQLEKDIQDIRQKKYTIHDGLSMTDIRESIKSEIFKPEEIYPIINDATNCGVFCNR